MAQIANEQEPPSMDDSATVAATVRQQQVDAMRVAFQWGYMCCEKGMNFQAAMAKFETQMSVNEATQRV